MKRVLAILSILAALGLVAAGCGGTEEDMGEVNRILQDEVVEPHCTNGDCEPYVEWCQEQGRDVMCLNPGDHEVVICAGPRALTGLWNHHPAACYGSCAHATLCNF